MGFKELVTKLAKFIAESKRVIKVTKKPTKKEYMTIVKVSAAGILIIGLIGFIIQTVYQVFF
jgi:protein transport protein SEC61 subunit gamma-like protein